MSDRRVEYAMGTREGLQALGEISAVGVAAETAMDRLQSGGTTEETETFDVEGRTFEVTVRLIADANERMKEE